MQPLIPLHQWIERLFTILVVSSLIGWAMYGMLRRTDDPAHLIVRWLLTVLVGGWMLWKTEAFSNSPPSWTHVVVALFGGIALAAIWRRSIASLVAKPFTALYDGGDVEIEPQPYYS